MMFEFYHFWTRMGRCADNRAQHGKFHVLRQYTILIAIGKKFPVFKNRPLKLYEKNYFKNCLYMYVPCRIFLLRMSVWFRQMGKIFPRGPALMFQLLSLTCSGYWKVLANVVFFGSWVNVIFLNNTRTYSTHIIYLCFLREIVMIWTMICTQKF